MRKLTSKEIKARLLDVLVFMDQVCRKHDIQYTLLSGTLLGAARHQGFIPWDDDVDVAMLWDDYVKFINLDEVRNVDGIGIHCADTERDYNEHYYYPYAKLEDNTTLIHSDQKFDKGGIFVDIFPIIAFPNDDVEAKKLSKEMSKRRWRSLVSATKYENYMKRILRLCYSLNYRSNRDRMLELGAAQNISSAKYVGDMFSRYNSFDDRFPKELFSEYTTLPFEGYELSVIANYEQMLKMTYGNWQQVPPVDQRVSHELTVYLKD